MKIELRRLFGVKPCPGNPRQNDATVDAVAAAKQAKAELERLTVKEAAPCK
ncbi:MAG: hypothetical protein WCB27_13275 [Thermoguttaceae bacterium]